MDIVVMNFALDHEPYLDDRYDVQVVDHSLATNAGGIIFRNTPFARRFVANWAAMAREYPWPFADNGALLEALASTWPTYTRRGRPCAELAIHNEHRTHGGRAFFECYQEVFAEAAGAPYTDGTADRTFGRVRLVAATRGFNNHSWKPKRHAGLWHPSVAWRPGMFVLHAKHSKEYPEIRRVVSAESAACALPPETQAQAARGYVYSGRDARACVVAPAELDALKAAASAVAADYFESAPNATTAAAAMDEYRAAMRDAGGAPGLQDKARAFGLVAERTAGRAPGAAGSQRPSAAGRPLPPRAGPGRPRGPKGRPPGPPGRRAEHL